jgi:hypothetical protein
MTLLLIDVAIRASILIAAVAAALLLYRGSAATRHFVWTLTLVSLLLLPALSSTLPRWEIAILTPATEMQGASDAPQDIDSPNREATGLTALSIPSAGTGPPPRPARPAHPARRAGSSTPLLFTSRSRTRLHPMA